MTAQLYDPGREGILDRTIDPTGVNVKIVLIDEGAYTFSAAHKFLSDIASGARVATSGALQNHTYTSGVFDADDIDVTVGASQPTVEGFAVFIDTGTATTSRLIAYENTATGLPYTPPTAGGTVAVRFDNGTNRIFKL